MYHLRQSQHPQRSYEHNPTKNPTRNYKMWPIAVSPLHSIFATLENSRNASGRQRGSRDTDQKDCRCWTHVTKYRGNGTVTDELCICVYVHLDSEMFFGNLWHFSIFLHTYWTFHRPKSPPVLYDSNRVTEGIWRTSTVDLHMDNLHSP